MFGKSNFTNGFYIASGPQKGMLLRGFIRGLIDLQLEAMNFHQINPYMIYLFEPLIWCTLPWYTLLMTFVTSHGLSWPPKLKNYMFWSVSPSFFFQFCIRHGLHIALEPQIVNRCFVLGNNWRPDGPPMHDAFKSAICDYNPRFYL